MIKFIKPLWFDARHIRELCESGRVCLIFCPGRPLPFECLSSAHQSVCIPNGLHTLLAMQPLVLLNDFKANFFRILTWRPPHLFFGHTVTSLPARTIMSRYFCERCTPNRHPSSVQYKILKVQHVFLTKAMLSRLLCLTISKR